MPRHSTLPDVRIHVEGVVFYVKRGGKGLVQHSLVLVAHQGQQVRARLARVRDVGGRDRLHFSGVQVVLRIDQQGPREPEQEGVVRGQSRSTRRQRHVDQPHFPPRFAQMNRVGQTVFKSVRRVVGKLLGRGIAQQFDVHLFLAAVVTSPFFTHESYLSGHPFQCTNTLSLRRFTMRSTRKRSSSPRRPFAHRARKRSLGLGCRPTRRSCTWVRVRASPASPRTLPRSNPADNSS